MPAATRSTNAGPIAGLLLILALLVVAAACGAVGAAGPSPSPSAAPASPAPTEVPSAGPSEAPSEAPAEPPVDTSIDLEIVDNNDVSVVVKDRDGALTDVQSGRAGDGMSVRWFDVQVENVDRDTLRVTWVGLPVDAEIDLELKARGDGYVLAFTQPAPPEHSDAIGFDRVLELDFASAVDAGDVRATFSTAG